MKNDKIKIKVLSRKNAIKYSYRVKEPCAIISVSDMYQEAPKFNRNPNIKEIIYFFFEDDEESCRTDPRTIIQHSDAEKIVNFVKRNQNVNEIIVHCVAGISRSSGIAAAIMEYFEQDENEIFMNDKYFPNMTCYTRVKEAFEKDNEN